jgi:N-acetylneuraminate synthase
MNPKSWAEMITKSRELEMALGYGVKKVEDNEKETMILQRRSIRVKKDMEVGDVITEDDLEVLRPCPLDALPPYHLPTVLGKTLVMDVKKGDSIKWSMIKES